MLLLTAHHHHGGLEGPERFLVLDLHAGPTAVVLQPCVLLPDGSCWLAVAGVGPRVWFSLDGAV